MKPVELSSKDLQQIVIYFMSKQTPIECISIGVSLVVSTIATQLGSDAAKSFSDEINNLLSKTVGVPFDVDVEEN